ncbi:glycosyl hydrolase family 3 C-terminal domain-containing protein [Powellomyces hirtus]|nr:glycosyl hydrolase family 3 C-terminal domain-containing protein [Powellomyces hirtus]
MSLDVEKRRWDRERGSEVWRASRPMKRGAECWVQQSRTRLEPADLPTAFDNMASLWWKWSMHKRVIGKKGLHGILLPNVTIFNCSIGQASSFNPALVQKAGQVVGDEAQAVGVKQILALVLNLAREPRWARIEEGFGEDPYVAGITGVAYTKGLEVYKGAVHIDTSASNILCQVHFLCADPGGEQVAQLVLGAGNDVQMNGVPISFHTLPTQVKEVRISEKLVDQAERRALWDGLAQSHVFDVYKGQELESSETVFRKCHMSWKPTRNLLYCSKTKIMLSDQEDIERLLDSMTRAGYNDPHPATPPVADMMTTRSISVTFLSDDKKASASWVKHMSHECRDFADGVDDHFDEMFKLYLVKNINVLSPDSNWVWDYAILFEPYDLHAHHPVRIFPFGDTPRGGFGDFNGNTLEGQMFRGEDAGITNLIGERKVNYAEGCKLWSNRPVKSKVAIVFVGIWTRDQTELWQSLSATTWEHIDQNDLKLIGASHDLVRAVQATGTPTVVVYITGKPIVKPWIAANVSAIIHQWYPGRTRGSRHGRHFVGEVKPSGKMSTSAPREIGNLPAFYNH